MESHLDQTGVSDVWSSVSSLHVRGLAVVDGAPGGLWPSKRSPSAEGGICGGHGGGGAVGPGGTSATADLRAYTSASVLEGTFEVALFLRRGATADRRARATSDLGGNVYSYGSFVSELIKTVTTDKFCGGSVF